MERIERGLAYYFELSQPLDEKTTEKLTALLRELSLPMLVASHHQGFTAELADDVLTL